ncbi:MAG: hypothetical protein K2R98_16235 [Gemmataceae bacterium]|nr:hypothetical protein [Gemmataceae bacterium]
MLEIAGHSVYGSKYNPIERRFFPHVGRVCQGMLFDTLNTVVRLMRRTATTTALRATVNIIRRGYETGRQIGDTFKQNILQAARQWILYVASEQEPATRHGRNMAKRFREHGGP